MRSLRTKTTKWSRTTCDLRRSTWLRCLNTAFCSQIAADASSTLQSLVETFGDSGLAALQSAFEASARAADQLRSQGDADWWKGYESALAVVGAISEDLIEHVQERAAEQKSAKFGLEGVFQGVVMTYLTASGALSIRLEVA